MQGGEGDSPPDDDMRTPPPVLLTTLGLPSLSLAGEHLFIRFPASDLWRLHESVEHNIFLKMVVSITESPTAGFARQVLEWNPREARPSRTFTNMI